MTLTLSEIINSHEMNEPRVRKYVNYISSYDTLFSRYRDRPVRFLEIGVQHGGSLLLWKRYFHPASRFVGIDLNADCKKLEDDQIRIYIGDQGDQRFIDEVAAKETPFDIIVDDGSHVCRHQILCFERLFVPALKDEGLYIVEDCHSSYDAGFGGGYRKRSSFMEYAKGLADTVNWWHAKAMPAEHERLAPFIRRVMFESSLVVVEKFPMQAPPLLSRGRDYVSLDVKLEGRLGAVANRFRRSGFVRNVVRRSPVLYRLMSRQLTR